MADSIILENTRSGQVLPINFEIAVTIPLNDRCLYLTKFLQNAELKELQYIFPSLVKSIFGVPAGVDWGLLTLQKNIQVKEFDSFKRFLAPDGPILRIASNLTEEFDSKFEFPIACLPAPSQTMIQEGKISDLSSLYSNILKQEFFPSTLQLNAFEFYFFHFTYYIVNRNLKNSLSNINLQNTLYAHILEDYLKSFLPTNNRSIPLDGSTDHLQILNYPTTRPGRPSFLQVRSPKQSLFKKEIMLMVSSFNSNSSNGFSNSPAETLRSETFILILKEMYCNQNSLDQQNNSNVLMPKIFIPSVYHIWMVRIMVKHLHFFFNSKLSSNQSSEHGQIIIDSLGHLKTLGMTQFIQKEIYCLLKSVLDHWPLDASFRVPLETYLSYIRPWKYIQCVSNPSVCNLNTTVWQKFMTENLLFYTTIFQQVLRRFLRMDLSCHKNAYMLFRLTKVICTPALRDMIIQAERDSLSKSSNLGTSSFIPHSLEKFSLHESSYLEIAGFSYLPLFSGPVLMLINHLLTVIHVAREQAILENATVGNTNKSFLAKICSFFETLDDAVNSDDNSQPDIYKTVRYLEKSSKALCDLFREVSPPTLNNPLTSLINSPSSSFRNNRTETIHNATFHELSTDDRIQIIKGRIKPVVNYNGNPDLQPIRTYEIAGLVRCFNGISQQLNDQYGTEIQQIYYRNTILGKMCRRILSKPVTYFDVQKSKAMTAMTRTPVHLPPRINLRFLADKYVLAYLFVYLLSLLIIGIHPITKMFLLFVPPVFLLIILSLIYPVPSHSEYD